MLAFNIPAVNQAGKLLITSAALCVTSLIKERLANSSPGSKYETAKDIAADAIDSVKDFLETLAKRQKAEPATKAQPAPTTDYSDDHESPGEAGDKLSGLNPAYSCSESAIIHRRLMSIAIALDTATDHVGLVTIQKVLDPDTPIMAATVSERKGCIWFRLVTDCGLSNPLTGADSVRALVIINRVSKVVRQNLNTGVP
jgi:hypothetical protein